jgi:hypothetical protein
VKHLITFTAYARLHLYETALKRLDYRVLYLDTDSVVFLQHPSFPSIPLGNHFGQYTDQANGRKIVKWASCGPKSYCYVYEDGDSVVKMKGISSSFSEKLDYETLRDLVLGKVDGLRAFHEKMPEKKLLLNVARKRKAPCIVFPQFRIEKSLTGRVWTKRNFTKAITFKFVKRKLVLPSLFDKIRLSRKNNHSPLVHMASILARCERSVPWGFGESHMNDDRMFGYSSNPVTLDTLD